MLRVILSKLQGCVLCEDFSIFDLVHRTTQRIVENERGEHHHRGCKTIGELSSDLKKFALEFIEEGSGHVAAMHPVLKKAFLIAMDEKIEDSTATESRKIEVPIDSDMAVETAKGELMVRRRWSWQPWKV